MPLLNETTVSIRVAGGETPASWTELTNCFSLPDFGIDAEYVDVTHLKSKLMESELGIGDPGSMEFQFRYRKGATDAYKVLDGLRDEDELEIQVLFKVGLTIEFPINGFTTKFTGGGVNEPLNFTMAVGIGGDFDITLPA